VGGMSGAFIPVSEDGGHDRSCARRRAGRSINWKPGPASAPSGSNMVAVPGSTSAETISAIIADEMAIGVMNNKTHGGAHHSSSGKGCR